MLKKITQLFLLLLLTACGYESINSKKNLANYDFSISDVSFEGNKDVNLKIKEKLNNYMIKKKEKNFTLNIKTTSEKIILAKNETGDPTSFKITVTIFVEVLNKASVKDTLKIQESFNYNNNSNKFGLKRYEKEIKNNLAESSSNKIIFKLSNIQ